MNTPNLKERTLNLCCLPTNVQTTAEPCIEQAIVLLTRAYHAVMQYNSSPGAARNVHGWLYAEQLTDELRETLKVLKSMSS